MVMINISIVHRFDQFGIRDGTFPLLLELTLTYHPHCPYDAPYSPLPVVLDFTKTLHAFFLNKKPD